MANEKKTERTDIERKSVSTFEIKDGEKGEVEAIIATIGVIDRDGDILRAGAIKSGSKAQMSDYGHSAVFGARPVGKGTIGIRDDKAVFTGRLFLKTADGRDTFETLKELDGDAEWSFGFRVTGWEAPTEEERKSGARRVITKLETLEVSPVLRGAGIGTRTLRVKADGDGEEEEAPDPAAPAGPTPAELEAKAKLEREQLEAKAAADKAAYVKARDDAMEHFHQVQRNLKRVGYVR